MEREGREELDALRAEKARRLAYTYNYNARNYYRAVCLFPAARRGELDRAIQESGAGSVSGYLLGLVEDDLRRRGISASDQDGAEG